MDPAELVIHTDAFGALAVRVPPDKADEVRLLAHQAALYSARAKGRGTRRAYASAWKQYRAWCDGLGLDPLSGDAGIVGLYVAKAAETLLVPTLRVHLAAIALAHRLAGRFIDTRHPRIAMVLEGVARTKGAWARRQAAPVLPDTLAGMLAAQPAGALGVRNRAMLLIGFGAALRRSELVGLGVDDVEEVPGRGLRVLVRFSKGDQTGRGREVGVCVSDDAALCPLRAWRAWMELRRRLAIAGGRDKDGREYPPPLFCRVLKNGVLAPYPLSGKAVERLVNGAAVKLGLADARRYTGHSLRAGLLTAAAEENAELHHLMKHAGQTRAETTVKYLRSRDLWKNNVTERVFVRRSFVAKAVAGEAAGD